MTAKPGIRCPACGKKVAEALEGSLTVTCPRSTCGATFSLTVEPRHADYPARGDNETPGDYNARVAGMHPDDYRALQAELIAERQPIDIRTLQAETVNQ